VVETTSTVEAVVEVVEVVETAKREYPASKKARPPPSHTKGGGQPHIRVTERPALAVVADEADPFQIVLLRSVECYVTSGITD
jgi:hypothetical protein